MTEQAVNHDHRVAHHPESGKRIFQLKGFEEAWGYAASVRVGNTIHVSGTVSIDDEGNPLAADDMEGQVRNAYRDIARALAAHGATMSHVVREALMTTDMARFLKEGAQARGRSLCRPRPAGFGTLDRGAGPCASRLPLRGRGDGHAAGGAG
jgi:enamine deaminase RidA (YjgF/YER057c/UK114 family)